MTPEEKQRYRTEVVGLIRAYWTSLGWGSKLTDEQVLASHLPGTWKMLESKGKIIEGMSYAAFVQHAQVQHQLAAQGNDTFSQMMADFLRGGRR